MAAVLAMPEDLRRCCGRSSRLNLRSRTPINAPIHATGCPGRRHSQSGSPISASNASAAITMKRPLPEISTSTVHALKFGSEAIHRLR